jgi:hypothetical protein
MGLCLLFSGKKKLPYQLSDHPLKTLIRIRFGNRLSCPQAQALVRQPAVIIGRENYHRDISEVGMALNNLPGLRSVHLRHILIQYQQAGKFLRTGSQLLVQ